MKWLTKNAKLLEGLGLLLLLAGWFLNWRSIERWNDATQKLDSFQQMVTADYHNMQMTANVRLEASISRALPQPSRPEDIDNRLDSYKRIWNSPEVRQRWLARAANNLFSLDQFITNLGLINDEFQLGGAGILEEPKNQLELVRSAIRQATNGKDVTSPIDVPIPQLQNIPIEKANEIEMLSAKASESVFNANYQIADLVNKRKQSKMLLYN